MTRDKDARQLQLMTASPDTGRCEMNLLEHDLPAGTIELRADVELDALRFAWRSASEGEWRALSPVLDASILSDEATLSGMPNFTGAFVGMACQDMAGAGAPADFAFFRYEGHDA